MATQPAIAIIPARYGSTRFPGKPLANKTGKPLIQHVFEAVQSASAITRIIIATDDPRIERAVKAFGGQAVMTRSDHANGTSRIAEVVANLPEQDDQLVVNIQGDEPQVDSQVIDQLVRALAEDNTSPMATVASPFGDDEDSKDPNIVKVVVDQQNHALYFSRSAIPYDRDRTNIKPLKHLGVYAYRRDFLLKYVALPPTPLEQAEQLEQLRALENGFPITVIQTQTPHHGIDTPQQYEAFVKNFIDSEKT